MSEIPSPEEQKAEIKRLEAECPLVIGGKAYIISNDWFVEWKRSVGFFRNDEPNGTRVGEIKNEKLIEKNGKLKEYVFENSDFQILSEGVFKKLEEWFGCDREVTVPVVAGDDGTPRAVTREVHLVVRYKNKKESVTTDNFTKIVDVVESVKDKLKWDEDELRVFDYFHKKVKERLDVEKTVGKCQLISRQDILIDSFSSSDKMWLSDKKKEEEEEALKRVPKFAGALNGKVGLNNLGNTCFFNSGTQCLMHTRVLARHMLDDSWKSELNVKNPIGMKGRLASAFASLCKETWREAVSCVAPRDLKHVIGQFAPQFSGWGQQDSHELVTFMLDGIHEDLNRCKEKPYVEAVLGDGTNNATTAADAWKRHLARNDSIVVDKIHGQFMSHIECPNCDAVTVVFDPYMSLPIPINKPHTVKVPVIFVPYDFAEKGAALRIAVPSNTVLDESTLGEEIGKAIGRPVKDIIVGTRYSTSSPVAWSKKLDSYSTTYAFEVPDKEALYMCGSVKMPQKATYSIYASNKEVSSPFLIQIPGKDVEDDQIRKLCQEKLRTIWDVDEDESAQIESMPEEKKKLVKDAVDPKEGLFKEDEEFVIEIGKPSTYYYSRDKGDGLTISEKNAHMIENPLTVTLNPKHKFSFPKLTLNYEEVGQRSNSRTERDSVTLAECFDYYREPEVLDEDNKWLCPKCKEFVCARKKVDIWKVPEVLIIQLKRFSGGKYSARKLETYVDFPDILDMRPFIIGPQKDEENLTYRLYAVSNHMGGLGGGHYTAHAIVQNPFEEPDPNAHWYSFNDSSCSGSSSSHAHSSAAYVLFYERIGPQFGSTSTPSTE